MKGKQLRANMLFELKKREKNKRFNVLSVRKKNVLSVKKNVLD